METEASQFESSEMLATFIASTPLLEESWKLCSRANTAADRRFVLDQVGDMAFVAFSGVQSLAGLDPRFQNLVSLDTAAKGLFSELNRGIESEEPAMVHAGLLHLFLSVYSCPNLQYQMAEAMKKSKSIVFTGHSLGGAVASLSALSLLCCIQNVSSPPAVLCVTFGSPVLGNKSLSRAVLRERWIGNFCNLVSQHDILPRLLFTPLTPLTSQLQSVLQFWQLSIAYIDHQLALLLDDEVKAKLFHMVLDSVSQTLSREGQYQQPNVFWPFGTFMFCTDEGAICIDNPMSVIKLLYIMLTKGSPSSCVEDHLKYEYYVRKVYWQLLNRRSFMDENLSESSYAAGTELALQSSGIVYHEQVSEPAIDCLKIAKQVGRRRSINCAELATKLSKITPLRAQIEWYKESCDDSDNQMGYYDSFKRRVASRKGNKVNMNRLRLARFWDHLIDMMESNQLPYDFHMREKFVNAAQFYKLLVEPLDIAEYYRTGMHKERGHYIEHGRERRYIIFDKWWSNRKVEFYADNYSTRSRYASLTQDSCFWARVEEAEDNLNHIRSEIDISKRCVMWAKIDRFVQYARKMIESKEVSKDVLAKNSSYSMFVKDMTELKSQL